MSIFLKGCYLWRHVVGHITEPIKIDEDIDEKFTDRLKEMDKKKITKFYMVL